MAKKLGIGKWLLFAALLGMGCTSARSQDMAAEETAPGGGTFSERVLPVLKSKFAPLLVGEKGLRLDSWETLIAGSDYGEVLIPFDAERSLLIRLATELPEDHPLHAAAAAVTPDELALVRRWIDDGARNDDGEVPYADARNLLYVADQSAALVSVVDMDHNLVVRTVDLQKLGFSATAKPHHVVVEPDGSYWYLSLIAENKVLKFNRDNELVGQVDFERPGMLALDTERDVLFVGRSMAAVNPPQRIGVIRPADMSIEEIDVFFPRPHAIAVDGFRNYVYTASLAVNQIAGIDMETGDLELHRLDGPTHTLVQFALSPDGSTLVVGGQLTGQMFFFDASKPPALPLLATVDVNAEPWHPVFSHDGRYVYVGNKRANTVTVLDAKNRSVAAVIEGPGLSQPHGTALSPDGKRLYVSNNNLKGAYTPRYPFVDAPPPGVVTVIDTATNTVVKALEVGAYAAGMGTRAMR
ncbi:hypothetical protein [Rhodocaloribacter sp.]